MKKVLLLSFLILFIIKGFSQKIRNSDSLALVDFYNSTNGNNWDNSTNWLSTKPINTWYGVTTSGNRIVSISLNNNNLNGIIPQSISNLTELYNINISHNNLFGNIPNNIINLYRFYTNYDANHCNYPFFITNFDISYNNFLLDGINNIDVMSKNSYTACRGFIGNNNINYSNQAKIQIIKTGNILSVSVGGFPYSITYKWYKNGILDSSKTSDSTYLLKNVGVYHVEVNSSLCSSLTLVSYDLIVGTILSIGNPTPIYNTNKKQLIQNYPNPIKDFLYIKAENIFGKNMLYIYDVLGNLVINKQIVNNYTDNISLKKGVYFLRIINDKGVVIKTDKLIKE